MSTKDTDIKNEIEKYEYYSLVIRRIGELLKEKNWTVNHLSEDSGVSQTSINRLLHKERCYTIDAVNLYRLIVALCAENPLEFFHCDYLNPKTIDRVWGAYSKDPNHKKEQKAERDETKD